VLSGGLDNGFKTDPTESFEAGPFPSQTSGYLEEQEGGEGVAIANTAGGVEPA
jgi:hypothetical protein